MTTKTETQYQHLEPRPARITGSYSSNVDGSERRSSSKPSMGLIRSRLKNSPRNIKFRWRRCSRLWTMWPRIIRSLSNNATTKRPDSAHEVSSDQRRNEIPDRRKPE